MRQAGRALQKFRWIPFNAVQTVFQMQIMHVTTVHHLGGQWTELYKVEGEIDLLKKQLLASAFSQPGFNTLEKLL